MVLAVCGSYLLMVCNLPWKATHRGSPSHAGQDLVAQGMCEGTGGGQAAVKKPCQVGVPQAMAGEATGGQLLSEGLCAQCQFLSGLLLGLGHTLRPPCAEQGPDPTAPSGTPSTLRGGDDDIDVPFDERTLGGDLLQEFGQAVRQRIPGGWVLPVCSRLCEQALDVGSHVQSLVAHEDLHGKGQGPDERPKAFNDGFLLILRFEREVDRRDLQHAAIAAPGGRAGGVEAEP